ncbi:MAG: NAD(P)H-binding protein [Synergistaceae bacterium]|nr:NAD(P)H-binding protein [Synergistaceae bacterium]
MSRVLAITGTTGKKSGGVFTQILCKHADEINTMFDGGIRTIIRATSNTSSIDEAPLLFETCIGSIGDVEFLTQVFEGVDTVIHIAGIHWSKEIVEAAACCHVRRLIMVHTTGIYSKYKQAGEKYRQIDEVVYKTCKENGIVLTILRPTMIYGNAHDMNVIKFVRMVDILPMMPVVNGGRYELQPVNYKDLGAAYYQVLVNEDATANRDFILSGEQPILLRDMLTIIGKYLGKKTRFISCPFLIAYAIAWIVYVLTFGKTDYREKVQRLCEPRAFPHTDATESFGYMPMSFEKGVACEVKEYLEGKRT